MTSPPQSKPDASTPRLGGQSPQGPEAQVPLVHGGDLESARVRFPAAPEPFIDLSTGINPYPYPISTARGDDFSALPSPQALHRLAEVAATFYGAPAAANVVAAPGSQILMSLIADAAPQGIAAILGPTYAEHARIAALAGHRVSVYGALPPLGEASLAIAVNPNNPDGRLLTKEQLLAVAARQKSRGGLLVVDEAFMDVGPRAQSLAPFSAQENIVVLRSFGKFFGLGGLRLSFALTSEARAAELRARLGPWPVSGPALRLGSKALGDDDWCTKTRAMLRAEGLRLHDLLQAAGLQTVGRCDLFCLVASPRASELFDALGEAGIFVRSFKDHPTWLRFGLPGTQQSWQRLSEVLRLSS